jgi:outer membrane biogenesis lipoprotein LolB
MTDSFIVFPKIKKNQTIWNFVLNNRLLLLIIIVFSHLFIASCANHQLVRNLELWQDRLDVVRELSEYRIKGSLSLLVNRSSFVGSFDCFNDNFSSEFIIRDYFGKPVLTFDPNHPELTANNSAFKTLENKFMLINDSEFNIFNSLLAFPGNIEQDRLIYDNRGWLIQVKYPEWTVNYESYQTLNGLVIPKKITIKGRSFRLTLVNSVLEI